MLKTSISKNSLILCAFAVVTAGLLAATYQGTREKIAEAERHAAEKALLEIVPDERHDNDILTDAIALTPEQQATLGVDQEQKIYQAKKNGKVIAVIVPAVAPDGYSGDIKLIVGVNRDGSVAGVRALHHNETPGLGDKVDIKKSPWVLSFNGKALGQPTLENWKVKKDGGQFDQFTGATITPRAVVNKVKDVLLYVQQHHADLFGDNTPATQVRAHAAKEAS